MRLAPWGFLLCSVMIECFPRSLCSWDFTVSGLPSGRATVEFDWLREEGRIVIGGGAYDVCKQGMFSGHWTLQRSGHTVADARKRSAFSRSFAVTGAGVEFSLQAESVLTRVFEIHTSGGIIGRIAPVHAFTRRAGITCPDTVPGHFQLFAFWLAALTWKRSANNSGGAS